MAEKILSDADKAPETEDDIWDAADRDDANLPPDGDADQADTEGTGARNDDHDSFEDDADADGDPDGDASAEDGDEDEENDDEPRAAKPAGEPDKETQSLQHKYQSERGRRLALERKLRTMMAPSKPGKASSTSRNGDQGGDGGNEASLTDTQLEKLRDDYPEFTPVLDRLTDLQKRQSVDDQYRMTQAEIAESEQVELLHETHDDGFAVIAKDPNAWNEWWQDQPRWVRDIVRSNAEVVVDGKGAAEVLTLYKDHLAGGDAGDNPSKPLTNRRQQQLAGASGPAGSRNRKPVSGGVPRNGSYEEIWDAADRQESARSRR